MSQAASELLAVLHEINDTLWWIGLGIGVLVVFVLFNTIANAGGFDEATPKGADDQT